MFTAADDAAAGIPVVHGAYPEGEEGIQKSLTVICQKIREGAPTAVMKSYAANLMKQAGFPEGPRAQGAAALEHIRANVMYAPDALGTEQIQRADVTLCVEGAPVCIPCGDCDDLVCALGTILAALGLEVQIVRQQFGGGHQQHVLVEVKDEYGHWYPLDPSSKTMPAGVKAPAQNETRHSPFDGAEGGARFVGIGALSVWVWKKESWHHVGVGTPIEKAASACCGSCATGRPCEGDKKEDAMTTYTQRPMHSRGGFGAPWPGVTAFVAQWVWLNQAWGSLDASGRSWSETLAAAYARAEARNWIAGDAVSRSDLLALIIASAFSAKAVSSMPDQGQRAADDLNATWLVIARKVGYTPDMTVDALKARVAKENNPAAAAAITASFELVIGVVAIAAWVVIYCFVIYFAYKIIDSLLARIVAFAELIYLQVQVQKIVDRHLADPNLPWTEAEKAELQKLEDMQRGAHGAIIKPPSSDKDEGTPAWVWIGGGVILTGGVLAVVYRDEIKRYLNRGSTAGASEGRRRRYRRVA